MEPEVWRRVCDLFSDCLARPEPERATLLARLETDEPAVAREIRALLKTYMQDREFLEKPAIEEPCILDACNTTRTVRPTQLLPELPGLRFRATRRSSPFFWLLLGANVIVLGCFLFALSIMIRYPAVSTTSGWSFDPTSQGWLVTSVARPGPAAGVLEAGDSILEVNGKTNWWAEMLAVPPGGRYSLRVSRHGQTHDLVLTNEIVPNPRWFGGDLAYLIVSLTYFLTAVVVTVMQPGPRITRLAWGALAGEAVTLLCMLLRPFSDFLQGGDLAFFSWMQLVDGPHLAVSFHFYSRVFRRGRNGKAWTLLIWLFYVWATACAVCRRLLFDRFPFPPAVTLFWSHPLLWHVADVLESKFYLVAPFSVCVAVAYSYVGARGLEDRRRARWVAVGSLAGILPYMVLRWASTLGLTGADYSGVYGVVPAALIPIATGYAILKHRLFDIHVVLRTGVQYLVARNFLRFVLALPALALVYSLVTNANRTVRDVVLHNSIFISLVVLVAVVLKFRERLGRWLDRRFFREHYQQERILLALIESLRTLHSAPEMGERVVTELTAALHPESVHFFYYSPEDHAFVKGFGTDPRADGVKIPEGSALPVLLEKSDNPVSLESLPVSGVPLMSWAWLYTLRIDLIVPLNRADGSPAGFLLLGRKKSEEPYSPTDRNLLLGLGRQMAVVYENLMLQERLLRQQRANERMRARVEGAGTNWLQECPQCGRCFDCSVRICSKDGSELSFSVPVGRTLDGRYRLDRVLGRGGMGHVFRAQDLRLDREVAVKVMEGSRTGDSAGLRRFSREARALARLQHENIVVTYDFGVIEDETAYLIMEFVAGTTLRTEIASGVISSVTAAGWFHQLLEGVKAAHAAGIVHRDLKPENVLIARPENGPERVKIADFGVAKWLTPEAGSVSLTLPGTIVGSLHYMSPEQLAGQPVDARSDIFSIGVMVFEVLTGRIPFSGANYAERIVSLLQDSAPLSSALQDAPALQATVRKCLAKDPIDRFPSAAALQAELIPRIAEYRMDARLPAGECA
jgi:eukaryotic-like serine/threonine-protein kinase